MKISSGKKEIIIEKAKEIFVKKEADMNDPLVIASIIEAAADMSLYAGKSFEETYDVLLESFEVSENEDILCMLDEGIDKKTIYSKIGFILDEDNTEALTETYNRNSKDFEEFYDLIEATYDSSLVIKNMV